MPTLSEFRLTIQLRYEETEDRMYTVFRFETVRIFRQFSYEIDIEEERNDELNQLDFAIRGMTAPSQSLAATGPAVTELVHPALKGNWKIVIAGAKQQTELVVRIMPKSIRMLEEPEEGTIEVTINDEIEIVRD